MWSTTLNILKMGHLIRLNSYMCNALNIVCRDFFLKSCLCHFPTGNCFRLLFRTTTSRGQLRKFKWAWIHLTGPLLCVLFFLYEAGPEQQSTKRPMWQLPKCHNPGRGNGEFLGTGVLDFKLDRYLICHAVFAIVTFSMYPRKCDVVTLHCTSLKKKKQLCTNLVLF